MKYTLVYYLNNQSELFSTPQVYQTEDLNSIKQAVQIAQTNGHKIVRLTREQSTNK